MGCVCGIADTRLLFAGRPVKRNGRKENRMKKRRILAIMMSVIMGIGMLAGCGKKEAEGGSEKTEEISEKKEGNSKKTDGEKKQITMWFWVAAT